MYRRTLLSLCARTMLYEHKTGYIVCSLFVFSFRYYETVVRDMTITDKLKLSRVGIYEKTNDLPSFSFDFCIESKRMLYSPLL